MRRRKNVLDDTAKELMDKHGGSVKTHSVDIRVAPAVDDMIEEIWADGGPLTGLVNNAAGNFISPTKDLSTRGFDAIAGIVFHGSFYVTHFVMMLTPAFDMADGTVKGPPFQTQVVRMEMTLPGTQRERKGQGAAERLRLDGKAAVTSR